MIITALVPVLTVYFLWDRLPAQIPSHFNAKGVADDFIAKENIYSFTGIITFGLYALMVVIPFIDPKGQIKKMGNNYFKIRLVLQVFISGILAVITVTTAWEGVDTGSVLLPSVFLLLAIIGNYLQSVKPNYFVGIRTPWTLESEKNWVKTHRFTGRLWMITGGILVILSFIKDLFSWNYVFTTAIIVMVASPILYSFLYFLKEKKKSKS